MCTERVVCPSSIHWNSTIIFVRTSNSFGCPVQNLSCIKPHLHTTSSQNIFTTFHNSHFSFGTPKSERLFLHPYRVVLPRAAVPRIRMIPALTRVSRAADESYHDQACCLSESGLMVTPLWTLLGRVRIVEAIVM